MKEESSKAQNIRPLESITGNIWKIKAGCNVYFLNLEEPILIDTGSRADRAVLELWLSKLIELDKIKKVIFTHLHYDHIGNFDLFKNADFFSSKADIRSLENDPKGTVFDEEIAEKFKIKLNPVSDLKLNGFRFIWTPGHTIGSICIFYEPEKILFSGDTIFKNKKLGRTDLPTSDKRLMRQSVIKLVNYNYKILCSGHD